jgi:hypothetical protein
MKNIARVRVRSLARGAARLWRLGCGGARAAESTGTRRRCSGAVVHGATPVARGQRAREHGGTACAAAVECSGAGVDGAVRLRARLRRHGATNVDAVARRLGEVG